MNNNCSNENIIIDHECSNCGFKDDITIDLAKHKIIKLVRKMTCVCGNKKDTNDNYCSDPGKEFDEKLYKGTGKYINVGRKTFRECYDGCNCTRCWSLRHQIEYYG